MWRRAWCVLLVGHAVWFLAIGLGVPIPLTRSLAEYGELTGIEQTNIALMYLLSTIWFLAVGCSIGSFLNVVAYRMPRGMSLGMPKSHCPACSTPLGRRDNLPVVGWLLLRGRCRYCDVKISPRYPLVEAAVGAIFVLLLFVELLSGGANLAGRRPNPHAGFVWIIWFTKWDLVGIYLYHVFLGSVLVAIGLIDHDGHPLPRRLPLTALLVGLLLSVVWDTLHPVPFVFPRPEWWNAYNWRYEWTDTIFSAGWTQSVGVSLPGAIDGVCGLLAGGFGGLLFALGTAGRRERHNVVWTAAIVGTFLGWQAIVSTLLFASVLRLLQRALATTNVPALSDTSVVAIAAALQLLLWRLLENLSSFWPGTRNTTVQIVSVAVIAALALLARTLTRPVADADVSERTGDASVADLDVNIESPVAET